MKNRFRRDSKTHPIAFIFSLELVHAMGMICKRIGDRTVGDLVVVADTGMKLTQNIVNISLHKDLHWFLQ